ncbi:MAG: hypothetical protein OXF11_18935 [Deltaproteobacteria bacterium]|nr:hypothetical protein [Deltaproteobacteria bacterium]
MRSAIVLLWLSLGWTVLCFLLYRDRDVILQASAPVWIAAAVGWMVYRTVTALLARRRAAGKPRTRKRAASATASRAGARRTPRSSASGSRKRTS